METEPDTEILTAKVHFKVRPCQGCVEDQPNQEAHYGGCLPDLYGGETWDDMYYIE
jgi:hypothetical protein